MIIRKVSKITWDYGKAIYTTTWYFLFIPVYQSVEKT